MESKQAVTAAKLEFIAKHLAAGRTVYLATALRVLKITPKTAAAFDAIGKPVVKMGKDGSLLGLEGGSYVDYSYTKITAN